MSAPHPQKDDSLNYNIADFDIVIHKKTPYIYGVVLDRGFAREPPAVDDLDLIDETEEKDDKPSVDLSQYVNPAPDTGDAKDGQDGEEIIDDDEDFDEDEMYEDEDEEFPLEYNELEVDFGEDDSVALHLKDTVLIDRPMEEGNYCTMEVGNEVNKKLIIGKILRVFPLYDLMFLYCPKKPPANTPKDGIRRHILLPNVPGHYLNKFYPAEWRDNFAIDNQKYHCISQVQGTTYRYYCKINKDLIISFTRIDLDYMAPVHCQDLPEISHPEEFSYFPGQQVSFKKKSMDILHFSYVKGTKGDLLNIFTKNVKTCRGIISKIEPLFSELQPLYNIADDWYDKAFDEREDHLKSSKLTPFPVSGHINPTVWDRVLVDPLVMNALPHYHVNNNQQEWSRIVERYHTLWNDPSILQNVNQLDFEAADVSKIQPDLITKIDYNAQLAKLKQYCDEIHMNGVELDNPHYSHDLLNTILPYYNQLYDKQTQDAANKPAVVEKKNTKTPPITTTLNSKFVTIGDGKILPVQQFIQTNNTNTSPVDVIKQQIDLYKQKVTSEEQQNETAAAATAPTSGETEAVIPEKVNHEWLHRCAYVYRQKTACQVQWCVLSDADGTNPTQINQISTHNSIDLIQHLEQFPITPGHWYMKQNQQAADNNNNIPKQQLCLVVDSDHIQKVATVRLLKKFTSCQEHKFIKRNAQHLANPEGTIHSNNDVNTIHYDCGCCYELQPETQLATYFELVDLYQINVGNVVLMYDNAHDFGFEPLEDKTTIAEGADCAANGSGGGVTEQQIDTRLKAGIVESYRFGACIVKWWNNKRSIVHPSLINNIEDENDRDVSSFALTTEDKVVNNYPTTSDNVVDDKPEVIDDIINDDDVIIKDDNTKLLSQENNNNNNKNTTQQTLTQEQSITRLDDLITLYKHFKFKPLSFELLFNQSPPDDHAFASAAPNTALKAQRLRSEYKSLTGMPSDMGMYTRTWANRADLFSLFISGAKNTPFYGGLFRFDVYLPPAYPREPPKMKFVSRFNGNINGPTTQKPLHPNIYADGHICLSLLNTWDATNSTEQWNPDSTLYQLFVSLYGLVLGVTDPFYAEAGYDTKRNTKLGCVEAISYNENSLISSLSTLLYLNITNPDIIKNDDKEQPKYDKNIVSFNNIYVYHLLQLLQDQNLGLKYFYQNALQFNQQNDVEKRWTAYLQQYENSNNSSNDVTNSKAIVSKKKLQITDQMIAEFKAKYLAEQQQAQLKALQTFALPPDQQQELDTTTQEDKQQQTTTLTHEAIAELVYYPTRGFVLQLQRILDQINSKLYQKVLNIDLSHFD